MGHHQHLVQANPSVAWWLATREGPQRWIAEPVWSIEEASAIEASHSQPPRWID